MKYIKFVILFICCFLTFVIYKLTFTKTINYLALGDSLTLGQTPFDTYNKSFSDYLNGYLIDKYQHVNYINNFAHEDYRITDLIRDIESNKELTINNKRINISNAIATANIITISIGSEELFYKIRTNNFKNMKKIYAYIDEMFKDLNVLITDIRKFNDKPILFIGYYSPIKNLNDIDKKEIDRLYDYIKLNYKELGKQQNIFYIDIYDKFNEKAYYLPNANTLYPSLEGYNYISNEIINVITNNKLIK